MTPKLPSLFFRIIILAIVSWFFLHLLAIFGVFVAFAYPVWWLISPTSLPSITYRLKPGLKLRPDEPIFPSSFKMALANGGLVLLLSAISLLIVFAESKILFRFGFPPVEKTVTFVIPSKGQYRLGEIFPMKIEIVDIKQPINAIQADISFDSTNLDVVDISTQDSFAEIFVQKEINNELGYARLTGGLPNPGFFSDHGIFGTVYFKGKSPGLAKVDFLPSSMVLANDGRGTNVLKELASASYLVLSESITAEEAKIQGALIRPQILGQQDDATKMNFYQQGSVLGQQQLKDQITQQKNPNLLNWFLISLKYVNSFILQAWSDVFIFFSHLLSL